ncbi:hypothetical protein AN2V17_11970 [Vallitalea sp. AN17-2]|uniref:Uncharacterized protein n=1 Tax=Vallitalea maricola TaxID=3074433 RepID=A0ACB5UGH3_9FIRM|nr:hypothetical protein AN2V17_11970 [Vallitalea sp. AN17-2]
MRCYSCPDSLELLHYHREMVDTLFSKLKDSNVAYTKLEKLPICMCGFRPDNSDSYFFWGPVCYRNMNFHEVNLFNRIIEHKDSVSKIFMCSMRRIFSTVSFFMSVVNDKIITVDQLFELADISVCGKKEDEEHSDKLYERDTNKTKYRLRIEDELQMNHAYSEEQFFWEILRNGDVERMKEYVNFPAPKYPLVIDNDYLKNEEYMAVVGIAVISRIAIEAGVSSSESFLLSDMFLKKISKCRYVSEFMKIRSESLLEFTKLVKNSNEGKTLNIYVEDCKKGIQKNIFNKIRLSDMANDLGMNPAYLSRIFSEHVGMTFSEYIHKQKIKIAEEMLKFSDKTIAEIAEYLNYSSQSHFGYVFKSTTGMTPREYRRKHHPAEF